MKPDPKTRYDYCKMIAGIIDRPLGMVFKYTEGWSEERILKAFYDLQSLCKEKTRDQQAKICWWFLKEIRVK